MPRQVRISSPYVSLRLIQKGNYRSVCFYIGEDCFLSGRIAGASKEAWM